MNQIFKGTKGKARSFLVFYKPIKVINFLNKGV
jgi:hypothetical protein